MNSDNQNTDKPKDTLSIMQSAVELMINRFHSLPNRVVINEEGEALSPKRALEQGLAPDIIFVRKDGWMLGAPVQFENVAFKLWEKEWAGFMIKMGIYPIDSYDKMIGEVK